MTGISFWSFVTMVALCWTMVMSALQQLPRWSGWLPRVLGVAGLVLLVFDIAGCYWNYFHRG